MFKNVVFILCLGAILGSTSALGQETFYALKCNPGQNSELYRIVLVNGVTSVDPMGVIDRRNCSGLTFDSSGKLWALGEVPGSADDHLLEITDPENAEFTDHGAMPFNPGSGSGNVIGALGLAAWDSQGNLILAQDQPQSGVTVFDPKTRQQIHGQGSSGWCYQCPNISLTWAIADNLSSSNSFFDVQDGNQLFRYSYNPQSCSSCTYLDLGKIANYSFITGLTTGRIDCDDTLYAVGNKNNSTKNLIKLDPQTGAVVAEFELHGFGRNDEIRGLAQAPQGFTHDSPDPGVAGVVNTVNVRGATPGTRVFLAVGTVPGFTPLAGCGSWLDIKSPKMLGPVTADGCGSAMFVGFVRSKFAGRSLLLQAYEEAPSCAVSTLGSHVF